MWVYRFLLAPNGTKNKTIFLVSSGCLYFRNIWWPTQRHNFCQRTSLAYILSWVQHKITKKIQYSGILKKEAWKPDSIFSSCLTVPTDCDISCSFSYDHSKIPALLNTSFNSRSYFCRECILWKQQKSIFCFSSR